MSVPAQELSDFQRVRRMLRPQDHQVAPTLANQLQPAQDEGAHQDLAQLCVLCHQRPQVLTTEFEKFAVLRYASDHQASVSGNHRHLAGELARLVAGNHPFPVERRLDDIHAS
jgi:hypothetical protein